MVKGDRRHRHPGDHVGQLLGAGPLLAYNHWTVSCDLPAGFGCGPRDKALSVTQKTLARIVAGHRVVLRRSQDSYPLGAVGGGRMTVASGGAVEGLTPTGSRLATVPASAVPPRAVALSRAHLAVQGPLTLDLYNPVTGARTKSLPLGPAAALELAGVTSKLALLLGPRAVVLVRLGDGKLISLSLARAIDPKLTEAGLLYAYNTPKARMKGQIVFESTARLLARV